MKRIFAVFIVASMTISALAMAQGGHHDHAKPKPVTMTGEVLDMNCFMIHPESAVGVEHMKCAKACMAKGLPIGFMSTDGTVYLIVGREHESANATVAEFAGKHSRSRE